EQRANTEVHAAAVDAERAGWIDAHDRAGSDVLRKKATKGAPFGVDRWRVPKSRRLHPWGRFLDEHLENARRLVNANVEWERGLWQVVRKCHLPKAGAHGREQADARASSRQRAGRKLAAGVETKVRGDSGNRRAPDRIHRVGRDCGHRAVVLEIEDFADRT